MSFPESPEIEKATLERINDRLHSAKNHLSGILQVARNTVCNLFGPEPAPPSPSTNSIPPSPSGRINSLDEVISAIQDELRELEDVIHKLNRL